MPPSKTLKQTLENKIFGSGHESQRKLELSDLNSESLFCNYNCNSGNCNTCNHSPRPNLLETTCNIYKKPGFLGSHVLEIVLLERLRLLDPSRRILGSS
jgi:hypothetical protein